MIIRDGTKKLKEKELVWCGVCAVERQAGARFGGKSDRRYLQSGRDPRTASAWAVLLRREWMVGTNSGDDSGLDWQAWAR